MVRCRGHLQRQLEQIYEGKSGVGFGYVRLKMLLNTCAALGIMNVEFRRESGSV